MNIEPCRSCHAPVIWAVTEAARSMPVDAEPSAAGTLVLEQRVEGRPPLARTIKAELRGGRTDLHTSHFATCPEAAKWRTRKAAQGRRIAS